VRSDLDEPEAKHRLRRTATERRRDVQIPLTGNRSKNGVFDFDRRNRIKQNAAIRRRESRFVRDLFIKSMNLDEGAGLLAGLVGMAFANGAARAAAHLSHFRRPGGTCRLGAVDPQRQHGHQDLDEGLQVHNPITAITVPRIYFESRGADYIPQPMGQLVAVDAALPLTMEPHVAMELPKGLETVEPVWSQWACFIGQ
jgi:hypothetical protein